jgi:hypothetical protein
MEIGKEEELQVVEPLNDPVPPDSDPSVDPEPIEPERETVPA